LVATPDAYYLALDAIRLDYMFKETPCVLASFAKIDALKHQIDAVKYMLDQDPVRIMLADDVGLGKTIMAGLLIRELLARGRISRVLIITPRSLLLQWQRELEEKFEINIEIIRSSKDLDKIEDKHFLAISIDLAKRKSVLERLSKVRWDLAVFDEAHNLTVRRGGREVVKTLRYMAAEKIALITPNVILLTATPHHGKFDDFVYRLRLLDPSIPEDRDYVKKYVARYVIRRLREEVTDEYGKPLIPPRESRTISVNLSDIEYEFYKNVTSYVLKYFNVGFQKKSKAHIFVAYVFQKRASSSIYAIVKTLERRLSRLENILKLLQDRRLKPEDLEKKIRELEREKKFKEILKYIALEPTESGIKMEINIVKQLLDLGNKILRNGKDSKIESLLNIVEQIRKIETDRKLVIFTQYRDTLEYLVEHLKQRGYKITFIHGNLNLDERKKAEEELRKGSDILVATDVASEGLNLQIASVLINYDLPWNPTRIDQRIGRIHRYGQTKKVLVFNLLVNETIDNYVYAKLFEKIEEIKATLGKLYDYLGTIVTFEEVEKLIETWIREPSKLEEKLDEILRRKVEDHAKQLEDLIESYRIRLPEDPRCRPEDIIRDEDVENFVLNSLEALNTRYRIEKCGTSGKVVCYEIWPPREVAEVEKEPSRCYVPRGVFRKELLSNSLGAVYVGLEHPLTQALIKLWKSKIKTPIVLQAENKRFMGWLMVFSIYAQTSDDVILDFDSYQKRIIKAGKLIALVYDEVEDAIYKVPLSIIKSLVNIRVPYDSEELINNAPLDKVKGHLLKHVEDIKWKVENELDLIKKGINTKYTSEIHLLTKKLSKTNRIDIKEKIQERLNEVFDKMKFHTQHLESIKVVESEPQLIAIIRLMPIGFFELGIERAKDILEIGKQGEEIVKRFEEKNGCKVIDFRDIFIAGFDFISICPDEVKYIEVKTVSGDGGSIYITQREWEFMKMASRERIRYVASKLTKDRDEYIKKANVLGDFVHMYVVDLHRKEIVDIKNPATNLWKLYERFKRPYYKIVIPYSDFKDFISKEVRGVITYQYS